MSEPNIDLAASGCFTTLPGADAPATGECLACYVARMLDEFGCDTTLRFAARFGDETALRASGLERRLGNQGGFCDCEILINALVLHQRFWTPEQEVEHQGYAEIIDAEPPTTLPACATVRRGSTQPCGNWVTRRWSMYG